MSFHHLTCPILSHDNACTPDKPVIRGFLLHHHFQFLMMSGEGSLISASTGWIICPSHKCPKQRQLHCLPAPLLRCCCRHIAPKYLNTSISHNALCPTKVWYVWHQGMSVTKSICRNIWTWCGCNLLSRFGKARAPYNRNKQLHHFSWILDAEQNRLETPQM